MLASLLIVLAANALVFVALGAAAVGGRLSLGATGRLRAGRDRHVGDRVRRAELGARRRAAPVAAVLRLGPASGRAGAADARRAAGATGCRRARSAPRRDVRLPAAPTRPVLAAST